MTGDLGIALIALLARADWFMILYIASRISTAIAGIATLPVNTRLTITAIVVRRTRSNDCQLYWPANTVDIGDPTLRTGANHGPYGYRIENITTSVFETWFYDRARIDAFLPNAHQLV